MIRMIDSNLETANTRIEINSKAIFVPEDALSYTDQDWSRYFKYFPDFNGNPSRAGLLMGGFCRGISFAEEEAKSAGEITTKLPIAILTGEPENVYPVCYIPTARLIGVAQHYIEELSEFDQDAVLTFERVDGEIFFIGTPSEYFELCGIEEYSHGVDAFAGYNLSESNPLSMSMAKYDSQDHEFKALGRQVKYAKQNGFHQEAIQILEQRQKAAIQYRGKEVKK